MLTSLTVHKDECVHWASWVVSGPKTHPYKLSPPFGPVHLDPCSTTLRSPYVQSNKRRIIKMDSEKLFENRVPLYPLVFRLVNLIKFITDTMNNQYGVVLVNKYY